MGIRIDFTYEKWNGEKLNAVERIELEKKINIALGEHIRGIVEEAIPSYITYKGCSHKLVGHDKHIMKVLK